MKKFLCALLLAALLCGLFAQAAGAVEYEPGSTTERFEGARVVSEWREILAMGEELGAVLYVRAESCEPLLTDGTPSAPDENGHQLTAARFAVLGCLWGEYEGAALSLTARIAPDALAEGQCYVIRVTGAPPALAGPGGEPLAPEEAGKWTLTDILPVAGNVVYVPAGYYWDLRGFLHQDDAALLPSPDAEGRTEDLPLSAGAQALHTAAATAQPQTDGTLLLPDGTVLQPDNEQIRRQLAAQAQYAAILAALSQPGSSPGSPPVMPEYYGGGYLNEEGDLTVVVTDDSPAVLDALRRAAQNPALAFVTGRFSYNDLIAARDEIAARLTRELAQELGVAEYYLSEQENRVIVGVKGLTEEKEAAFRKQVCGREELSFASLPDSFEVEDIPEGTEEVLITTERFEGTLASGWRQMLQRGEELGSVLYVRAESCGPLELQDEAGGNYILADSAGNELRLARFAVLETLHGSCAESELSLLAYDAPDRFAAGQTYVIRVMAQAPELPPEADALPAALLEALGDWRLCEALPVVDDFVYLPTGFYWDLPLYLKAGQNAPAPEETAAAITGNRVNVRAGAGTSYRSLGKLNKGDTVTLLGTEGKWARIAWNNGEGYVWHTYVKPL